MKRIFIAIMDKIARREELKIYLGHGDFDTERGWYLFGYWVSAERFLK